jgi:hypothetical protein
MAIWIFIAIGNPTMLELHYCHHISDLADIVLILFAVFLLCVISLPHVCPGRVVKGTATLQIRTRSGRLKD